MIRGSILALLFISLSYASVSTGADQDRVHNLKAVVSMFFEDLLAKQASESLAESGIAKTDSDRIVKSLIATSSSCVVDALVQQAEEQSVDVDKLLDEAEASIVDKNGSEEFLEVLNADEFERKMESCILIAFENAGIQFEL